MADTPATATSTTAPSTTAPSTTAPALSQLRIDRSAPLQRRRKRWPWVLAVLVLAAAAAAALLPRKMEVQTTTVLAAYPSQQYAELSASGYVVAQRRAAVASKGTGRLIELRVREGSVVKKDDLIGRLDATDVQAAIAASQSGVLQAQAGKAQAVAALGQARAELANAEVELQRQQDLKAQGFVSPQAVDGADRRLAVARSALATPAGGHRRGPGRHRAKPDAGAGAAGQPGQYRNPRAV